jgi:hypothetical protein
MFLNIPLYQYSVIVGTLLSDAHLSLPKTCKNVQFEFKQSFFHFEYF